MTPPSVPSPVPAGSEREARVAAEQAAAKALWGSLPLGTPVFVRFLGGEPRAAHTVGDGWASDDGMTGCTPWSVRVEEVWIPAALAAVVSSSPATPERCPDCNGEGALPPPYSGRCETCDGTGYAPPATPEGGLCSEPGCALPSHAGLHDNLRGQRWPNFVAAPPPASPAETREGMDDAYQAAFDDVIGAHGGSYAKKHWDAAIRPAVAAALAAASPAVSPHAGSKPDNPPSVLDQFQRMLDQMAFKHPTGEWFVSRTVVQGEIDRARQQGPEDDWPDAASPAPSLPGEAEKVAWEWELAYNDAARAHNALQGRIAAAEALCDLEGTRDSTAHRLADAVKAALNGAPAPSLPGEQPGGRPAPDICGARDGDAVCNLPPHSVEQLPEGHPWYARFHQSWHAGRLYAEWSSVTPAGDRGRLWPDGTVGPR